MPAHFTEASLKFLRGLRKNNDREWFNPRKPVYEAEIKAPMLAVIDEVTAALAEFAPEFVRPAHKCMLRIYRDIRFSKDKHPYKTNAAAWWARQGMEKTSGAGFYFELNPEHVTIAAGAYMPEKDQLLAIRRMLLERVEEYRACTSNKKLRGKLTPFDGLKMSRAPKGFPADHPALDLIVQRQWGVSASLPAAAALTPGLVKEIVSRFKIAAPMVRLLNEPIAPSAKKPVF
jgi:uncharacterized protein (TIGR02453 family)